MGIINNLAKDEISSAILRLHRDMSRMETLINEIESKNLSIDRKLSKADELTTKLKVYNYISNQLLNIAEKWCVDHHSPVYWAVMQDKMETCSHCNSGQSSCGSDFYVIAQGVNAPTVDYDFCNDCQSIYSVEDTCQSCDSCESCNSCQGCDVGQSSRPVTCYSCYSACQGCDSCESCNSCEGCYSGNYQISCQSQFGSGGGTICCESSYSYCYQNQ